MRIKSRKKLKSYIYRDFIIKILKGILFLVLFLLTPTSDPRILRLNLILASTPKIVLGKAAPVATFLQKVFIRVEKT